jgi:hypothetical protein
MSNEGLTRQEVIECFMEVTASTAVVANEMLEVRARCVPTMPETA